MLGARAKLRCLLDHAREARVARTQVAEWVRTGSGPKLDIAAADEVKHRGLLANHDE
jgi:hypothetical protein